MEDLYAAAKRGGSLAGPIERNPIFPPMVGHMVAVGEETGQLEHMLAKIADFYETEVDAKVKALTSLIEPLMIVFVGGVGRLHRDLDVPADLQPLRKDPLSPLHICRSQFGDVAPEERVGDPPAAALAFRLDNTGVAEGLDRPAHLGVGTAALGVDGFVPRDPAGYSQRPASGGPALELPDPVDRLLVLAAVALSRCLEAGLESALRAGLDRR